MDQLSDLDGLGFDGVKGCEDPLWIWELRDIAQAVVAATQP